MQVSPEVLSGVAAGLLGSMLYAFSVVVYRSLKEQIRPLAVASIKMWVALPLMTLLVIYQPEQPVLAIPIASVLFLTGSVLIGAVLGDTIYLISQERIGVSYAFPIAMSSPILTYILTVWLLGEPLLLVRLTGAVIAVVGVSLLSIEQNNSANTATTHMHRVDLLGTLLAVLTALFYASGTVMLQVGVTDIDPIAGNFVRVLVGSCAFVPITTLAVLRGLPFPTRHATLLVAIAGFFGMGIGSIMYVLAVKLAGAAITSVVGSTAPLFALPVSVLFLKERVTLLTVVGVLATIIGVVMVVLGPL